MSNSPDRAAGLPRAIWASYTSRNAVAGKLSRGVAQFGRAPALGAGGREFKSRCPDHFRVRQGVAQR